VWGLKLRHPWGGVGENSQWLFESDVPMAINRQS